MKLRKTYLATIGILSLSAGSAVFALGSGANAPTLLETLEHGIWQMRTVGAGMSATPALQLCVNDPNMLTQIQHRDAPCSHFVVKSTPNLVTVSYSCKGQGQGLTTIRKETGRLINIQSQGIRNGSPFSFSYEARRSASC